MSKIGIWNSNQFTNANHESIFIINHHYMKIGELLPQSENSKWEIMSTKLIHNYNRSHHKTVYALNFNFNIILFVCFYQTENMKNFPSNNYDESMSHNQTNHVQAIGKLSEQNLI